METLVAKYTAQFVQSKHYGLDLCKEFFIIHNLYFLKNTNCSDIDVTLLNEKYVLSRMLNNRAII